MWRRTGTDRAGAVAGGQQGGLLLDHHLLLQELDLLLCLNQ